MQGLQENITVLEFIVKFILKFIFKTFSQVYSKSLFYKSILQNTSGRLLLQKVFWYFICRYVKHLEGIITRYCASVSTRIVFNRFLNLFLACFWSCAKWFFVWWFLIHSVVIAICLMAVPFLTNQAVFDNISSVKIDAYCMLSLFLRPYWLPHSPRF